MPRAPRVWPVDAWWIPVYAGGIAVGLSQWLVPVVVAILVCGVLALAWHALAAAQEEMRSLGRFEPPHRER